MSETSARGPAVDPGRGEVHDLAGGDLAARDDGAGLHLVEHPDPGRDRRRRGRVVPGDQHQHDPRTTGHQDRRPRGGVSRVGHRDQPEQPQRSTRSQPGPGRASAAVTASTRKPGRPGRRRARRRGPQPVLVAGRPAARRAAPAGASTDPLVTTSQGSPAGPPCRVDPWSALSKGTSRAGGAGPAGPAPEPRLAGHVEQRPRSGRPAPSSARPPRRAARARRRCTAPARGSATTSRSRSGSNGRSPTHSARRAQPSPDTQVTPARVHRLLHEHLRLGKVPVMSGGQHGDRAQGLDRGQPTVRRRRAAIRRDPAPGSG